MQTSEVHEAILVFYPHLLNYKSYKESLQPVCLLRWCCSASVISVFISLLFAELFASISFCKEILVFMYWLDSSLSIDFDLIICETRRKILNYNPVLNPACAL